MSRGESEGMFATPLALLLVVRLYDAAGLPAHELKAAANTAADVLRKAKIDVEWIVCPAARGATVNHWPGCHEQPATGELFVRITRSPTVRSDDRMLGYAFLNTERSEGALATIFVDRVDALARDAGVGRSLLLGRGIAHELGHLLLGTNRHPAVGLMRALWSVQELKLGFGRDWSFSREEAGRMRERLTERTRIAADRR
jgi:hypothetical protein